MKSRCARCHGLRISWEISHQQKYFRQHCVIFRYDQNLNLFGVRFVLKKVLHFARFGSVNLRFEERFQKDIKGVE